MSTLRFKVGDVAVLALARTAYSQQFLGSECEIVQCGPWPAGTECIAEGSGDRLPMDADYVVMFEQCQPCIVADYQLRKPGEAPESPDRCRQTVDMFDQVAP